MSVADVIDVLAGLTPDSPLTAIRNRKPVTRDQAQASYRAVFATDETGGVTVQERFVLACFVAGLHADKQTAAFYSAALSATTPAPAVMDALAAEIALGCTSGPYGTFPKGPLSAENAAGPIYRVANRHRAALGSRLTAALEHVHMLVFHPRDAKASALQALLDAGWSNTDIVTISQLVSFLAFQIRAAAGLRTLAAASA